MAIPKSISYSALSDFEHCPWYYKLVNVDRVRPSERSIYAHWGTLIHKYVQAVLLDDLTGQEAAKLIVRTWNKFCSLFKQNESVGWSDPAVKVLTTIKDQFQKEFGVYKVIKVEERLNLPTEFTQRFKGFIDIVIELESGAVIIIDFKSCDTNYKFVKYSNKFKDYQLTLYKFFYCLKHDVAFKDVETYFVTIERSERARKPLHFLRVTSGKKKVENALEWLERALRWINRERYLKNRTACHKFSKPWLTETEHTCVFYNTEYCPKK